MYCHPFLVRSKLTTYLYIDLATLLVLVFQYDFFLFAVVCFAIDLSASYWVAHVSSQVATGTDPALDQSPLIRSFWEETVVRFAYLVE